LGAPQGDREKRGDNLKSTGRFTIDLRKLKAASYDVCRSCGRKLQRGVASYAGYDVNGAPLYVGTCCEALINELATHVYWWWEADKRPDLSIPLWRYMDFAKFVSILDSRGLYFARANLLGDRFEGASGIVERRGEWDAHNLAYFREAIRTAPRENTPMPSDEEIEKEAARLLSEFHQSNEVRLRSTYVSCWHANTGESEALWRLYCPPPANGVAIRTSVTSLTESWGDEVNAKLGKVNYIDFRSQFSGTHDRIFWKRKSLSHEAEVRAVIERNFDKSGEAGVLLKCDVEKLVHGVVVSPFAPSWFDGVVRATVRAFGMQLPIVTSELSAEPFF
jgi:hypothetical protein